jgi:CBS domain-containing protein
MTDLCYKLPRMITVNNIEDCIPRELARVREIMTSSKEIPTVGIETTVLEASKVMNEKEFSAVVVVDENDKVVGFFGERTLLTEFVRLNKRPEEVRVGEIMHMLYRIGPEATTKEAARVIIEYGATRLGVYDGDKFLGWVTLVDLSRNLSRENLLDRLRSHNEPETSELRCPNCKRAFMEKIINHEGQIVRWQCPNCKYAL